MLRQNLKRFFFRRIIAVLEGIAGTSQVFRSLLNNLVLLCNNADLCCFSPLITADLSRAVGLLLHRWGVFRCFRSLGRTSSTEHPDFLIKAFSYLLLLNLHFFIYNLLNFSALYQLLKLLSWVCLETYCLSQLFLQIFCLVVFKYFFLFS